MPRIIPALVAIALVAWVVGLGYQQIHAPRSALRAVTPSTVDIGFAQSMSLHHQQAIWMSQLMLDGSPTKLTRLAHTISSTQLLELGQMRGWLALWGEALMPATPDMSWMLFGEAPPDPELARYLLDCERSPTGMAGLASESDLDRLRTLQDLSRDEYFLRLMLAHHEGGVPMAGFAASQAHLPAVRELAARIALEQTREIGQIRAMLDALGTLQDEPP